MLEIGYEGGTISDINTCVGSLNVQVIIQHSPQSSTYTIEKHACTYIHMCTYMNKEK